MLVLGICNASVSKSPLSSEVVKKLWARITKNKRNINADASLKVVFGVCGKKVANRFELTKLVSKHLS